MKRTLTLLPALLLATAVAAAPAPADYSGTWTLDKEASKLLPKMFDSITNNTLVITQTPAVLSINLTIRHAEGPEINQTYEFHLDGSPVRTESLARTRDGEHRVPMTLRAGVNEDGSLALSEARDFPTENGTRTFTTHEVWKLSHDGKTLTIHRTDETMRGPVEYELAFRR